MVSDSNSPIKPSDLLFVAGHRGLIGSSVLRRLAVEGYQNIVTRTHAELDLADSIATDRFFAEHRPAAVVLAAGLVGGILDNQKHPADFIETNLAIQLSVLGASRRHGVRRTVFFGSSCMYPRECAQPMPEHALLSGRPESTSIAYALAKLAGVETCLAFNRQDQKVRFLPLIPNSVYGPGDNFNPETSHVLASLVRRLVEAAAESRTEVALWGSGAPRREFVYVDDVADATFAVLTRDIGTLEFPVNIGSGSDISIRELAEKIAESSDFRGIIRWDRTKPDGALKKLLDCNRAHQWGWHPQTSLDIGLQKTILAYKAHHVAE